MSHSSSFTVRGEEITVIHNGDWSGTAKVLWTEDGKDMRAEVPAMLLVELGKAVAVSYVRDKVISVLEQIHGVPPG